jgi:hypothetical protein
MTESDLAKLQEIHRTILQATAKLAPLRRRATPAEAAILAKVAYDIESALIPIVEMYR